MLPDERWRLARARKAINMALDKTLDLSEVKEWAILEISHEDMVATLLLRKKDAAGGTISLVRVTWQDDEDIQLLVIDLSEDTELALWLALERKGPGGLWMRYAENENVDLPEPSQRISLGTRSAALLRTMIRGGLQAKDWSIADLAQAIQTQPALVSRWMMGARPTRAELGKIAQVLELDLRRLLIATKYLPPAENEGAEWEEGQ